MTFHHHLLVRVNEPTPSARRIYSFLSFPSPSYLHPRNQPHSTQTPIPTTTQITASLSQSQHIHRKRRRRIDQRNRKVAIDGQVMRTEGRRVNGRRRGHVVIHLEIEKGSHGIGVDDEGALGEARGC